MVVDSEVAALAVDAVEEAVVRQPTQLASSSPRLLILCSDKMGGLGKNLRTIDWTKVQLTPFQKNFYVEHPEVKKMSQDEVDRFRRDNDMILSGKGTTLDFHSLELLVCGLC